MSQLDEKVEYGKSEVRERENSLTEVKTNEGLTLEESLNKKVKIKRTECFPKSDTLRESNAE